MMVWFLLGSIQNKHVPFPMEDMIYGSGHLCRNRMVSFSKIAARVIWILHLAIVQLQ